MLVFTEVRSALPISGMLLETPTQSLRNPQLARGFENTQTNVILASRCASVKGNGLVVSTRLASQEGLQSAHQIHRGLRQ